MATAFQSIPFDPADAKAALARRDVLLAPATPLAAPVLGEREATLGDGPSDVRAALLRCTRPFNFSGHPACAAPCGFTAGGLPIGLQIVGGPSTRRPCCASSTPISASPTGILAARRPRDRLLR